MLRKPKGTAAAVIIILRQNPHLNHKELASMLRLHVRRIQQITHEFSALLTVERH